MDTSFDNLSFINDGKFRLGSEVECAIRREDYNQFVKSIKGLDKRIEIGYDGSIRPLNWVSWDRYGNEEGDAGREIRTPVLSSQEGVLLLNEIFKLISRYGYTNKTTGYHANFSPTDKNDHEKINPFFLSVLPIWADIRHRFNRDKNKYCQDIVIRKDILKNPLLVLSVPKEKRKNGMFWDKYDGGYFKVNRTVENAIDLWHYLRRLQEGKIFGKSKLIQCHWHYAAFNAKNYQPHYTPSSRLEVRSWGNENYHTRFPEISSDINEIIHLFKESMCHPIKI
jgi:hypothetical protein